jgi:hypothetical protein
LRPLIGILLDFFRGLVDIARPQKSFGWGRMEPGLLDDPLVQSAWLPLVLSTLGAGVVRAVGGPKWGASLAGAALVVAFIVANFVILGIPAWPPRGSTQKIGYIAAFLLGVGLVLDIVRLSRPLREGIGAASIAAALMWIGQPLLASFNVAAIGVAACVIIACLGVFFSGQGDAITPAIVLLVVSIGLAFVALLGAAASTAQLAGAMAAAAGGFLMWNWPRQRFAFGAMARLGGIGTLAAMGAQLALFTRASGPALALLAVTAFAPMLAQRLPLGSVLRPIALGFICLVVAIAAGVIAFRSTGGTY